MSEGMPVTSTGGFPSVSEPTILPQKKAPEYFAGSRVFDVSIDEYEKLRLIPSKDIYTNIQTKLWF